MEQMQPPDALIMLESHFYEAAHEYKEAKTKQERSQKMNNCNALLDAVIDIRADLGYLSIRALQEPTELV
jgi:hypothetical protein